MPVTSHTTIDLFAGAGGLSSGLADAGFNPLFANDHEQPALATFRRNHPGVACSVDDIESIDPQQVMNEVGLKRGELDVLSGGPPCQGFSTYGKRNPRDARNSLFEHYLHFLDVLRPRAFVMENVVGILSMRRGAVIAEILERTRRLGYTADVHVLDAADFGVPQRRKRVFVLGGLRGPVQPPPRTHQSLGQTGRDSKEAHLFDLEPSLSPHLTVRDAIDDLPEAALPPKQTAETMEYPSAPRTTYQRSMRENSDFLFHHSAKRTLAVRRLRMALLRPGDYGVMIRQRLEGDGLPVATVNHLLGGGPLIRDLHECRKEDQRKEARLRDALGNGGTTLEAVLEILDSGGFANKYRRLEWDSPSHTLVAHMARDCSDFVHPEYDRFVTVREAARLQSFPDNYVFEGSQFQQFRQIGNAVPPLLGKAIGTAIARHLSG